jgi:hypothetical protein
MRPASELEAGLFAAAMWFAVQWIGDAIHLWMRELG